MYVCVCEQNKECFVVVVAGFVTPDAGNKHNNPPTITHAHTEPDVTLTSACCGHVTACYVLQLFLSLHFLFFLFNLFSPPPLHHPTSHFPSLSPYPLWSLLFVFHILLVLPASFYTSSICLLPIHVFNFLLFAPLSSLSLLSPCPSSHFPHPSAYLP